MSFANSVSHKFKGRAHGVSKPNEMNGLERWYANILEMRRIAGELVWYKFDAISLRLAKGTHYRPDFLIMTSGFELQVHETKGHWEDDALAKIKIASDMYPFRFFAIKKIKGGQIDIREVGEQNLTAKVPT